MKDLGSEVPSSRKGCPLIQIDRFKGIIIGGLSADVSSDVRVFDLLEHKWHKIDV